MSHLCTLLTLTWPRRSSLNFLPALTQPQRSSMNSLWRPAISNLSVLVLSELPRWALVQPVSPWWSSAPLAPLLWPSTLLASPWGSTVSPTLLKWSSALSALLWGFLVPPAPLQWSSAPPVTLWWSSALHLPSWLHPGHQLCLLLPGSQSTSVSTPFSATQAVLFYGDFCQFWYELCMNNA